MWCCSDGCCVIVPWSVCGWPENQTICETDRKKDGRSGAAVLIYTKAAVSAADTDCGRDTSTDFLYFTMLTTSSATNPKPLAPNPSPLMVSGQVGALFNSDRTGKQWCNSDNGDDTPSIYQIVDTQYGGRSCGSFVYLGIHDAVEKAPGSSVWE